jgi:TetR/AcrR family transcriptional regulator, transcriptional repressor for nem operon
MMDQLERTLTRKGQATRDRIVDAAARLIAIHGVAGTDMDDVRAAAEVSGSQIFHYFESKQALVRAVITRHADAAVEQGGLPALGPLDSFDALRAWTDAAIDRQEETQGEPECNLSALAGELSVIDEPSREQLSEGFLRWQDTPLDGRPARRDRAEIHAKADLDELAFALLTALQGGQLMTQTMKSTDGPRAAMNAALSYVRSFAS